MASAARVLAALVFLGMLAAPRAQQSQPAADAPPADVRPGHWIELRGALDAQGRFAVTEAEVLPPQKYEVLIGTVPATDTDPLHFQLLGQPIRATADTDFGELPRASLAGRRIKVEGRWRGAESFEAREIAERGAGRDRIVGRVDGIGAEQGSTTWIVMHLTAVLPAGLGVRHALPLSQIPRDRPQPRRSGLDADEDDELGAGLRLGRSWTLSGQLGFRSTARQDHDLDSSKQKDRQDQDLSSRMRLTWDPERGPGGEDVTAIAEGRWSGRFRHDEKDGDEWSDASALGETWLRWNRMFGGSVSLQIGRQDFDDPREWLYDRNLDALRLYWEPGPLRLELSASTSLPIDASTSERDENTNNLIAYLSNTDPARHLAAWIIDRRDTSSADDSPIWFGARALGKWLPRNKSWAEFALRRGYKGLTDLEGYAYDLGTTWSPRATDPFSFTVGYAFGSGDPDPLDGSDETFHQTGFQDDNGKLSGVTSFLYYGELVDPELSNLAIASLGVGVDLPERSSLDLIWHGYRQDEAAALPDFGRIRAATNGESTDLGWELDLVFGCRRWESFDIELVGGWFDPGSAFDQDDPAWLAKAQVRWRF